MIYDDKRYILLIFNSKLTNHQVSIAGVYIIMHLYHMHMQIEYIILIYIYYLSELYNVKTYFFTINLLFVF